MFAECRATIKNICAKLPTEKLCAILAFAQDGKMDYQSACTCFIGVLSSEILHTSQAASPHHLAGHYSQAKRFGIPWLSLSPNELSKAEVAYFHLWTLDDLGPGETSKQARDRNLIAIIREVLAEREAASNPPAAEPTPILVTA